MFLMFANIYTTEKSIFINMKPIKDPEIITEVIEKTKELSIYVHFVEWFVFISLFLLLIYGIIALRGYNPYYLIDKVIIKNRKMKLFGRDVGKSELVNNLVTLVNVLEEQQNQGKIEIQKLKERIALQSITILKIIEKRGNIVNEDAFNYIDTELTHEQFLIKEVLGI